MIDSTVLKRSPLEKIHRELGAKLGPFGGWDMPIEYEGALAEHRAVRERVGLFDLTHLGKVDVTGPGALEMLQHVVTGDLERVQIGEALYNLVLNDRGGVVEDLIVYRLGEERYFVVPNAANATKVLRMLEEARASQPLHLLYHQDWCFLAVQGPRATEVVAGLFDGADQLGFMECRESEFRRRPVIVTRSGYTGEVGFELFTYQDIAEDLWSALIAAGTPAGIAPCGLAARDVLRLEMGYPLYGQDLSEDRTPFEAGLGWTVDLDKGDFRGREALQRQREHGIPGRLRGLMMDERRHIPRAHHVVLDGGDPVGEVTSGTFSPLLQRGIALAYLTEPDRLSPGDRMEVDIRGRRGAAQIVRPPFVDRSPR
ncbi:MAG: glycine cleavage system aminomethyltransferase GcvT [Actinomycetota bacterium]